MTSFVLSGDSITLDPCFGVATLTGGVSLTMQGTAHSTVARRSLVLPMDVEAMVWLLAYTTPTHSLPGSGTARIVMDRVPLTGIVTDGGKALVLSQPEEIEAEFTVIVPAVAPGSPPSPDSTACYNGTARLVIAGARPTAQ